MQTNAVYSVIDNLEIYSPIAHISCSCSQNEVSQSVQGENTLNVILPAK